MELFLDSNPIVSISSIGIVHLEAKPIPPNPGRAKHGLVFFTEGTTGFYIGGKLVEAKAGNLVYLPKGLEYGFKRDDTATCIRFNFETAGEESYPFFCRMYPNSSQLKEMFLYMYHAHNSKRAGYGSMIMSTAYKIISVIQANESAAYLSSEHFKKIAVSLEYIESNFDKGEITTPMLASMCGMSARYYTILFNSFFMCSPKKYIINLKIDKAKQMLVSTEKHVLDISDACGFSDVYYFCKTFKQLTNMTPTEYRKKKAYL